MNRNGLVRLLIIAVALNCFGCSGAAEKAGGGSNMTNAVAATSPPSPSPTAGSTTKVAASNADPTPLPRVAADTARAQPGSSPASGTRGAGSAPPAKMPTPQIGSGGNDLFLFTRARAAINDDADLKAANVVIDVKEGVVTLSGTVASAALKSKAEQLLRDAGAKEIRNQLRVSAGH